MSTCQLLERHKLEPADPSGPFQPKLFCDSHLLQILDQETRQDGDKGFNIQVPVPPVSLGKFPVIFKHKRQLWTAGNLQRSVTQQKYPKKLPEMTPW